MNPPRFASIDLETLHAVTGGDGLTPLWNVQNGAGYKVVRRSPEQRAQAERWLRYAPGYPPKS